MKLFDVTSSRIILLSYPAGGFGNFIFHALTEYVDQTVKVDNNFEFSINGNSHSTNKYTNTYYHEPNVYVPNINVDPGDSRILVLCDNGITNDSYDKLSYVFPNAQIIRVVIDDEVRPIIYKTCIIKALNSDILIENKNQVISHWSDADQAYAIRENFTLFYHNWPFHWEPSSMENVINFSLKKLIDDPVAAIADAAHELGLTVIHRDRLIEFSNEWFEANKKYFEIYTNWGQIDQALTNQHSMSLSHITDIHDQGYINYCIERKYSVIIPVYDYKEWFADTSEILTMVKKLKYVQN
jgi:hypothetical protein